MPSNNETALHEGVFSALMNIASKGIGLYEKLGNNRYNRFNNDYKRNYAKRAQDNYASTTSIARATRDLVMSFPTVCSDTISGDTASMINKAIERKNVTMIQMVAAAAHLQGLNGREVISQLHKNMGVNYNVDDYINAILALGDTITQTGTTEGAIPLKGEYLIIAEQARDEFLSSLNYRYPESSFSENSINDFEIMDIYGQPSVILTEAHGDKDPKYQRRNVYNSNDTDSNFNQYNQKAPKSTQDSQDEKDYYWTNKQEERDARIRSEEEKRRQAAADRTDRNNQSTADRRSREAQAKADRDQRTNQANADRASRERQAQADRDARERQSQEDRESRERQSIADRNSRERQNRLDRQQRQDNFDRQMDYQARKDDYEQKIQNLQHQLVDMDVKKANELMPTLIILQYQVADKNQNGGEVNTYIKDSFIAGVKSRLIAVPSQEILDRVIDMGKNGVNMNNLIKATTKETSFTKDFLAGIQQAKIDAKKDSKLSKTNPIWRSLQARSNRSRINRLLRTTNGAAAITTLVLSQQEVDIAAEASNVDLNNPIIAAEFMASYNLMALCIVDEPSKVANFIYDGDRYFEQLSFSVLQKENDRSTKEVIDLLNSIK